MKNWLYQVLIHRTTNECYRGSLNYVAPGSRLLDVGIGNGIMLETFHPLIKSKGLKITGIDIDAGYLKHCKELIRKHGLEDYIDVCQSPAESYAPEPQGGFDCVLFCMSFMLLQQPATRPGSGENLAQARRRDRLCPGPVQEKVPFRGPRQAQAQVPHHGRFRQSDLREGTSSIC